MEHSALTFLAMTQMKSHIRLKSTGQNWEAKANEGVSLKLHAQTCEHSARIACRSSGVLKQAPASAQSPTRDELHASHELHVRLPGSFHKLTAMFVPRTGVTQWIEEQKLRAELGGIAGVIRTVATGLLVAGAKSFTHMITFVERYGAVLDGLLREAGTQVGQDLG